MRVATVADIHSPRYMGIFKKALRKFRGCDLFLLVGDLVLKSDYTQLPNVVGTLRESHDGPILACFGNEEYERDEEKFKSSHEITWVNDQTVEVEARGLKVGIIGSRGSLDRPTFWQRTHIKGIKETYRQRVKRIDELLAGLRADVKIVMSHYAPTYATLEGERESAWPEMACKTFENVIERRQPDVWFHGHAHRSVRFEVEIGKTLVVNASLPSRQGIVVVELPRKVGLERFI